MLAWTGSAEKKNGGVRRSKPGWGSARRQHPSALSQVMMSELSDWSEGMAFAQRLILLGVERLPLQVDLAELER